MGSTRDTYGGKESAHRDLARKTKELESNGKTLFRWEDNITMDLQEEGWGVEILVGYVIKLSTAKII
jgi:hypothetical protein